MAEQAVEPSLCELTGGSAPAELRGSTSAAIISLLCSLQQVIISIASWQIFVTFRSQNKDLPYHLPRGYGSCDTWMVASEVWFGTEAVL